MTHSILTRRTALRALAGGSAALFVGGCTTGMPQAPDLPRFNEITSTLSARRQIGFDLWTGVPGSTFGSPVDKTVGSRRISGPRHWRHPVTGKTLTIYVRENRERNGVRTRFLTMNADGTALSRVFDRRPGQAQDRYFINDAFVPMGDWGTGTERRYTMTQVQGGRSEQFQISIRMLRSNFRFEGRSGSIEYDWIARRPNGQLVFHQRYVYSPGLGFADYDNRL